VDKVKVGILGLGTVGGGTLNVLVDNAAEITRRSGIDIQVTTAAAREYDASTLHGIDKVNVLDDAFAVTEDPNVDVVIELIGGYSPAKELVLKAIENGKHVVTANKALIAMHGNEIFAAAKKKGVTVAYEAAVAGGIPIIKAMREGLAGNQIDWVAGIINGTGNFILTEMHDKGRDFADVLKEAQDLGYAEADPEFDVEGIDAAHKLTILASLAYGVPLQFEKCYTEGISKVEAIDLVYAEDLGYRIKHLGIARKSDKGIELRVHPTLIPEKRLIANVDGVMNAVLVHGNAVGPTLYYGAGAGSLPTASAVVADVIDIARAMQTGQASTIPYLGFQESAMTDTHIIAIDDVETAYYLRMTAADEAGVLAQVTGILADLDISVEAAKQPESEAEDVPLILLTNIVIESKMNKAIEAIEALEGIKGSVARIRVENLG